MAAGEDVRQEPSLHRGSVAPPSLGGCDGGWLEWVEGVRARNGACGFRHRRVGSVLGWDPCGGERLAQHQSGGTQQGASVTGLAPPFPVTVRPVLASLRQRGWRLVFTAAGGSCARDGALGGAQHDRALWQGPSAFSQRGGSQQQEEARWVVLANKHLQRPGEEQEKEWERATGS